MKKKYRIWLINQFACSPDMPGGTRHYEIASFFIKQGYSVEIFASDFNLSKRKSLRLNKLELNKIENINGIKWHWIRTLPYKSNNLKRYINLISFCINFAIYQLIIFFRNLKDKKEPDIIIGSSPQLLIAFCSFLLAKIIRKPFVFEVRDLWPQVLIDLGGMNKNNILIKVLTYIERLLYSGSDCTVVLASGAQEYVKVRGAKKVLWLPNGPDLSKFKVKNYKTSNILFNKDNPFRLIYAGAHGIANDLNNVIEAASSLQEYPIKFIFIGDGPEKEKLILKAKNLNNIFFREPISKDLIPNELSKADAILISLKEVNLFQYGISPNKLYDAYALARPIISTLKGSVNNEIKKYNVGLTADPGDPISLAKIIVRMYNLSSKERELMGLNGRFLAENFYSRNKINFRYLNLIEDLLNFYDQ